MAGGTSHVQIRVDGLQGGVRVPDRGVNAGADQGEPAFVKRRARGRGQRLIELREGDSGVRWLGQRKQ